VISALQSGGAGLWYTPAPLSAADCRALLGGDPRAPNAPARVGACTRAQADLILSVAQRRAPYEGLRLPTRREHAAITRARADVERATTAPHPPAASRPDPRTDPAASLLSALGVGALNAGADPGNTWLSDGGQASPNAARTITLVSPVTLEG
jgi:hypothetical protein